MTSPDELQVCDLMARNLLRSPTTFRGNTFVKLRISGTGIAYRPKVKEWTLRSRETWLSDRMVRRCAGLPVIVLHPDRQLLDGEELRSARDRRLLAWLYRPGCCRIVGRRAHRER